MAGEGETSVEAVAPIRAARLRTQLCDLLGIEHPVMLAGMASASSADLAAAVSNAGGIGTIGGVMLTPGALRKELGFLRDQLRPGFPFGVDLMLPQVGGNARKTNKDYTHGKLGDLIDILVEEKVKLFVCAVGVPPKWAVDKLHAAGTICGNMIGSPAHVEKALEVGIDLLIAQGTEAGGHTGDVATLPLIPQCVDLVKGKTNFFGTPVLVVAAGGIFDGRGLSAALCLGAAGVWVGTRFVAAEESGSSKLHKERVVNAQSVDTVRTTAFTGRPCRMLKTPYVQSWVDRPDEVARLTSQGSTPYAVDVRAGKVKPVEFYPALMGQAAGAITGVRPARQIVQDMVQEAAETLRGMSSLRSRL